ncbi:vam6/Vps39-like protein [Mercenaria mercenaria]|uniref:vam6/Vps39-like protein n=1 Tax=Mercenaria mercenaria TaxID=6596 RepID=UPI00234E61B8|nr:vam6/Vps39-like protein [Mercenaria mercenaria]
MDAYEYEKIQSFKRLGYTVECITAYDDTLLVAIHGDQLLRYKVDFIYDTVKNKQKVRLRGPDTFKVFGKPVSEIHPVPEFSLLLAVYDNMLNVYDLETYEFKKSLPNTKGMNVIAISVQNEVDSHGIYGTNLKVCVAVGKRLLILEWTGDSFIEIITDCVMDKYVKSMLWCKSCLYIGYKDEYLLLKPETGDYKEVFSFGNSLREPLMTKIDSDCILLGYDNTSVVVNSRAKPVKDECITWTGIPQLVEYDAPYVLAVLSRYLEVRTLDPSISIQQIEMKHVNCVCKGRNVIFVQCKDGIYMLTLRPSKDRIKSLVKNKHFQIAKQIKMQETDITMEEKLEQINKIQAKYAVHLFCKCKFKEAFDIFTQLETDPSHVIGMYPELLPSKLSNSLVYPEKIPNLHGRDLEKALSELVQYLQKKRDEIVKETDLKPLQPIMKHKRNDTLKNKDQALTVIDTTLLKCYLQINEAMIAQLLRLPGNNVHFEEAEKVLKATRNYSELIILYEQQHMHEQALMVMKSQASASRSPLSGIQPTIHKLQELGGDHLRLIFEYATWVMETDAHEGLKIFTEDMSTVRQLPRGHVASFVKNFGTEVTIEYLEHIIYQWGDTTEELHLALVDELRNKISEQLKTSDMFNVKDVKQVQVGEEEGLLGVYRKKFMKFIKTSTVYHPEEVLGRLPLDSFFEERAILLGKMGKHEKALGIYVYILEDLHEAEEYCEEYCNRGFPEVYLNLLHIYLQPPGPLALGLKDYKNQPKPRMHRALSMLETHATKIDMYKALEALPEEIFIKQSKAVLEAAIDTCMSRKYLGQIRKKLQYQEYLQTAEESMSGCRQYVKVDESTSCKICKRKIGDKSVFVCNTSRELMHYGCYNNTQ